MEEKTAKQHDPGAGTIVYSDVVSGHCTVSPA